MDETPEDYRHDRHGSSVAAAYVPPSRRTPEQAAEILAAERALADRAGDAEQCAIGNGPDDVQMVIAFVAARSRGSWDSLTEFCREWRKDKGAADQARINARPKPR